MEKINKLFKRIIKIIFITFLILFMLIVLLFIFSDTFTKKYFSGDGLSGESMKIYFGLIYSYSLDADIGHIRSQSGYILKFDDKYSFNLFPIIDKSSSYFPKNYYKIYWREREYLVEEKSIPFFCSSYNSGFMVKEFDNPIMQPFLVNNFDEKSKPIDKPHLPEIFRNQIYNTPIEAKVIDKYPNEFSIKINKGKRDNLFIGCNFYDNSEYGLGYEVVSMNDSTAIAQDILTYRMSKDNDIDKRVSSNIPSLRERYNSLCINSLISTFNLNYKSITSAQPRLAGSTRNN